MIRQLFLMRHAKSNWDNAHISDHDRPLAARGKKAAPEMGEWLEDNGFVPALIRSSTACRALSTAELVAGEFSLQVPIEVSGALYHAAPETIKLIAAQTSKDIERLMIVAHNPGLYELVNQFTSQDTPFPTAAIACLESTAPTWKEFFAQQPELKFIITPKEIDP